MATRPKTLWAGVAPVVIGAAMAAGDYALHWPSTLCALAGAVLIQIGANFANDYFDHVKGTDTAGRIGPTRVTQSGLVSLRAMRWATIAVFAAALLPGAYILLRGGWPFLVIGLASIVCAVLYTAGPYPLGYVGLGDLFVLVFFGPVAVGGTYYINALTTGPHVWVASFAPGLLSVALLTVNNLRDIDEDARGGKRTLAVRFGRRFAQVEYAACLFIAGVLIPLYFYAVRGSHLFALVPLLVFLFSQRALFAVFTSRDGAVLNDALARTGKVLLLFSVVFALGWLT